MSAKTYSFYLTEIRGSNVPFCGRGDAYQVNLQTSPIQLLAVPREGDPGYDPRMAVIARTINDLFGYLATDLLREKAKEMRKKGLDGADRLEVTAFLTERGITPGFSVALPVKECAPTPTRSKSFFGMIPDKGTKVTWDYSLPDVPAKPATYSGTKATAKTGGKISVDG